MRNRTAIRLLYLLAVLAGTLPPLLFLGYAFRQSLAQVDRELEVVGSDSLERAESVLDAVSSTLRKVASITQAKVDSSTVNTLRQAVFLDRYVQAIGIRDRDKLLCTSEQVYDHPTQILDKNAAQIPAPGVVEARAPVDRGFSTRSLLLIYSVGDGKAIEALINPQLFGDFYTVYARESDCRVFIYFDGAGELTSFGADRVEPPKAADLSRTRVLQWKAGQLVRVARSAKYPVYIVAVAPTAIVTTRWTRSATEFAIAGVVVSALLAWLVIRVARRSQSLEADLREAIKFGEIEVHYQPIMELSTGRCIGAESLLRWNHPRRGMIPAGEFIAVAEKTDLILPMTTVLLKKIADSLGPLLRKDPSLHISINLAPQHFATTQIIDAMSKVTQAAVPASQVIFEITERGLVAEENSIARTVMTALASAGSKLAVDDFGTGYSSLSYLQRFPLDYLKIDKAFVDGISSETESSGLVDQIIRIAKSLNLEIIAEGVEQPYQAVYLNARGVEYAQGWYFARPMPSHKFLEFVRTRNYANKNLTVRIATQPLSRPKTPAER